MVKEEEIIAEEAGGRGFMDMLGLGEEPDYLLCLSPSSDLSFASVCATTAAAAPATPTAASPTCASYLAPPPYHRVLSFSGQERYRGDGLFGFQYYGGDQATPAVVPQKSSPTAECSSSISSMSSSPTATAIPAASSCKPQAFKKKGSRAGAQRKAASPATTNKRPRVRREKLGERIIALQQLVSPFGKSDTASVLHEALGYIRFLHDQVQVLSSPYMQRLPPSARAPVQERAAGTGDLRSRGLCLVPISCTEHVAGNGGSCNGADMWSVAAGVALAAVAAEEKKKKKRGGDLPGKLP